MRWLARWCGRVPVLYHIEERLNAIQTLAEASQDREEQIMATLDEILAEVTSQTTKIDGINALMDGLRQQIADLIAAQGNVPPELQAKIDAVFAAAQANTAKIDEAIAENTQPPA